MLTQRLSADALAIHKGVAVSATREASMGRAWVCDRRITGPPGVSAQTDGSAEVHCRSCTSTETGVRGSPQGGLPCRSRPVIL